jgi:rsbT co-antagonist protein RsbR
MATKAELETRIQELEQEKTQLQDKNKLLATDSWLFRSLLAKVPDYVYFKDRESRFIAANQAHATSFNLQSADEMVGKSDFDFFAEEHARSAYEDEQKVIQTGQIVTLEEQETRPDGSIAWVLTVKMPLIKEGKIVGTFGISKDITDRRQAEEDIKELNRTLETRVQERTSELEHEISERKKAEEEHSRLQQEIIDTQRQAIHELNTPIIPLVEGIIVMPLIGMIDSMRANDIMRGLLAGITIHKANIVILDLTGVAIVDTNIAGHLNKTIQAAKLKGAEIFVTGMSDAVAETIVDLGITWGDAETLSDLQAGFRRALQKQGYAMLKKKG